LNALLIGTCDVGFDHMFLISFVVIQSIGGFFFVIDHKKFPIFGSHFTFCIFPNLKVCCIIHQVIRTF